MTFWWDWCVPEGWVRDDWIKECSWHCGKGTLFTWLNAKRVSRARYRHLAAVELRKSS